MRHQRLHFHPHPWASAIKQCKRLMGAAMLHFFQGWEERSWALLAGSWRSLEQGGTGMELMAVLG